jgi:hypothetical protein
VKNVAVKDKKPIKDVKKPMMRHTAKRAKPAGVSPKLLKGRANRRKNRVHKTVQKILTAWELYLCDWSMQMIADHLGITAGRVSQMLSDELKARRVDIKEMADQTLLKELERTRDFVAATYAKSKKDPRQADTTLKWLERQDKLLGLYTTKTELSGPNGGALRVSAQSVDLSRLSPDELAQLEALMQKAEAPQPALAAPETVLEPEVPT